MKIKGRRISKNLKDAREETRKEALKTNLGNNQHRQIFQPGFSSGLTKVSNTLVNRDRVNNVSRGTYEMKAPAKKAPKTKFKKDKK